MRAAGSLVRSLPFLAGTVAFWLVSSMSRPPIPDVLEFWNSDKLLHGIAYGGLATLAFVAARNPWTAWFMAVGYGVVDEIHQSYVPGRSCSGLDLVADALGAALAVTVAAAWLRRRAPSSAR